MKRFHLPTLALLALVSSLTANANVVSEQKARKIAENFLSGAPTRAGSGQIKLLWNGESASTRTAADPAFYIYSREGGGFAIVSGDDLTHPILGYSYSNDFSVEDMPENLTAWLSELRNAINEERKIGTKATLEIANEWVAASVKTRAGDTIPTAVLHETAKFNQGKPFNRYCPIFKDTGKQGIVGCTNVAVGIVMYFYKYPDGLHTTIPGWETSNYVVDTCYAGHAYEWDKILPSYKNVEYTDEQANAVSRLLADVATLSLSSFSKAGTGAFTPDAMRGLMKYEGYSQSIYSLARTYYTVEGWRKVLKAELATQPMVYTFQSGGDGHCVVYDGYDEMENMHINFGWAGQSDGYYCNDITSTTSPNGWVKDHHGYFNIKPAGTEASDPVFIMGLRGNGLVKSSSTGAILSGKSFKVNFSVTNISTSDVALKEEIVVALCNKNEELVETVSTPVSTTVARGKYSDYSNITCKIKSPIKYGDMLKVFYRDKDKGMDWKPVVYDKHSGSISGCIHLTDSLAVEEGTTLVYDKATGTYSMDYSADATATLYDADGNDTTEGFSGRFGKILINTSEMKPGKYTLKISANTYEDIFSLTFKVK